MRLDAARAERFAAIVLSHVTREFPHKLDQVLAGDADLAPPRELHPIFFGSFDWHSCVHGWWSLLTLRRLFPDLAAASAIDALADSSLTPAKVAVELAYLDRPLSTGFERPYGWGWLLYLHREAARHGDKPWGAALDPLARAFAARFADYLGKLTYPIFVGTHFNTAFALTLAHEWAAEFDPALERTIADWAEDRFAPLSDYRGLEPGGDEFLSPSLSIALLMARILPPAKFAPWFAAFLPDPGERFEPVFVSDRSDGKIAHLDGLNLSRAWALRALATRIAPHPQAGDLERLAGRHAAAALPHVAGDYMGEHWLVSFALLGMITEPER